MTDYGHDLLFGAFLTPTAAQHREVLTLARLCEGVGLDLVSVQDHPYQARFLDCWTLLAVIAAETSTIRVVPDVLNLPLRPPAVLARAVASLDLLSGGRVELGLGAGAFWDAIEAMGGPRRTPGEAVRALGEAIAVLRALWVPGRDPIRYEGTHYRLDGARPGPVPAHHVGIWVGATKPHMLALVRRLADGWLPSAAYVEPGRLAALNLDIDHAAERAGREPSDIRRLYNINGTFAGPGRALLQGPPEVWVDQLTDLTLRDGMSAFILASDDSHDLTRFGAEVAPAVRERVAAERARSASAALETEPGREK